MNMDALTGPGFSPSGPKLAAPETVDTQRKSKQEQAPEPQAAVNESQVQPEELLDTIKSITQDGLYSVRFEQYKDTSELIVKIMNNQTDEVVREIPPEELMELKLTLDELRGNLVNDVA